MKITDRSRWCSRSYTHNYYNNIIQHHNTHVVYVSLLHAHSSHMTLIGVHEMLGRVHRKQCNVTDLLVVDLCSSPAYFMMTHCLPVAGMMCVFLCIL